MNFITDLFRRKKSDVVQPKGMTGQVTHLTAKEKQIIFIKESLKPLLKEAGYRTYRNRWWKINEPFFNLLELQNFSWNNRNSVNFCFNFTTGFVKDIADLDKPNIHEGILYIRENYFNIPNNQFWLKGNGYHIDDKTDLALFTQQITNDFKIMILPKFSQLITDDAIRLFYNDDFWGPRVKKRLSM